MVMFINRNFHHVSMNMKGCIGYRFIYIHVCILSLFYHGNGMNTLSIICYLDLTHLRNYYTYDIYIYITYWLNLSKLQLKISYMYCIRNQEWPFFIPLPSVNNQRNKETKHIHLDVNVTKQTFFLEVRGLRRIFILIP